MRYFISLVFLILTCYLPTNSVRAQSTTLEGSNHIDIGAGLSLETVPAKYITQYEEDTRPPPQAEWVIIPATYETITKTVVLYPAYNKIDISPPVYDSEGKMLIPARAALEEVPEITREEKHRVVKTPSRVVKRIIPDLYHPKLVRKISETAYYVIRDKSGKEVDRYETPEALAQFLNTR